MRRAAAVASVLFVAGCSGPPTHVAVPRPPVEPPAERATPERDPADFDTGLEVRVGLHWDGKPFDFGAAATAIVPTAAGEASALGRGARFRAEVVADGATVRVYDERGVPVWEGAGPVRVDPPAGEHLRAGPLVVRGAVEISARADSLFAVNVIPLEDYLRGVVPKEIGPRPAADLEAVAAQAVAARTYTAKRLGQYNSLPFDVFADVQDQVYAGVEGENGVADEAIRKTRGMILADDHGLIEAFYSSTCGGQRSDIAAVWPHREAHPALRGGPDGSRGREWCRSSRHFRWTEAWTGPALSALVRANLPGALELPPGSVRGELLDLRIVDRGPSGRIARLEYRTANGTWRVPGDKNRWILRRPDGSILRSVFVDLDVRRDGGRVVSVSAEGRGNGHGVGMCQVGAIGRAEAGQGWWEILRAYYPGVRIRPLRGKDLPPGRSTGA